MKIIDSLTRDLAVGSEDTNDIMFVSQRLQWKNKENLTKGYISVNQKLAVEAVEEISFDKKAKMMCQSLLNSTLPITSAIVLAGVLARLLSQR